MKKNLIFLLLLSSVFVLNKNNTLKSQVIINEYSVSNLVGFTDNYGKYEDWIELYNAGSENYSLAGFYLSDNPNRPTKWQFPEGVTISAGGYIKVWASGRNEVAGGHFHTNFKLSQTKDNPEHIVFSEPSGEIIDQTQLEVTMKEHSRGRSLQNSNWVIFTNPTPGFVNLASGVFTSYSARPQMNAAAGFYPLPITIEISTTEPNSQIRYTLNGNEPTLSSNLYTGPITISQTTIVIARTFSNDPSVHPGLLEFNTYFINSNHSMPVISTSANQLTQLLNGNQYLEPFGTFEYFNAEGVRTTHGYGEFNKHGQDSWVHAQRSIDYVSRDECGYNYAIREALIPLTERNEFQRIILRAAGDDNYPGIDSSALLRDMFVQNVASKNGMPLDVRKGEKCVLYANGQYWGVYGMREKVDDHDFTSYYHNQDKYNLRFLKLWGTTWAEYGGQAAFDDWYEIRNYIKNNDMSNQANFEYVKTRYDYTSLVDYVIINSFVVCSDWINWNVGWWRGLNPDGGHQKWGYILWDEDATFNHYINYTGVPGTHPTVSPCYPEGLTSDPGQHIVVLNRLRNNAEFNQYYISRYIDLYNTAFRPDNIISYLDEIVAKMTPEMPRHILRWGGSMTRWLSNVQKIRNFINTRYNYLPQGLKNCYNLTGPYNFELNTVPAETGIIQLNSLLIDEFPWQGSYFGGVAVKLKAIPASTDYEFDYWELTNHSAFPSDTASEITVFPGDWENVIAHFRHKTFSDSLVINEINYNSASSFDPEDWIEFYNPHPYDLDVTGWIFKDDDDSHEFIFPEGTIIESNGYIVICRNINMFSALFPDVTNVIGNMSFGFSGSGELLRLYNNDMALVDHVEYDDKAPWPTAPDGNGATLELIRPELDNALPQSWMASPGHGSPGAMNSQLVSLPQLPAPVKNEFAMHIAPNPADNQVVINFSSRLGVKNGQIEIFNMLGKKVSAYTQINRNQSIINRGNLPSGVYMISFFDENGYQASSKIIFR
ncbi:MAG: CotH kinase family protein [Bacteroidales bacterium]|nr:CotH kinase family protein [Bacteroidales bacterium]